MSPLIKISVNFHQTDRFTDTRQKPNPRHLDFISHGFPLEKSNQDPSSSLVVPEIRILILFPCKIIRKHLLHKNVIFDACA